MSDSPGATGATWEQPTLDGLEPHGPSKRRRASATTAKRVGKQPASHDPIAHVMLYEQAPHLGRTFDYLVPQDMAEKAVPGARVRVPFGHRLLDGFVWQRGHSSDVDPGALKYIKTVQTHGALLDAAMRRDIELIAEHFGGTVPNILRVAVPPRVASVDNHPAKIRRRVRWGDGLTKTDVEQTARIRRQYTGADDVIAAVESAGWRWDGATQAPRIIWDSLPGADTWAQDMAWTILHALMAGRPVVVVLPDERHVAQMAEVMNSWGLRRFAPCAAGESEAHSDSARDAETWQGDFAVLLGSIPGIQRYRAYKALAAGVVQCAIGTRAAMYAPVGENALFVIVDDMVYQNADGFMPYANARGVLEVRAGAHRGALIIAGHCRSAQSQWDADHGAARVHGTDEAIGELLPRMVRLDREKLDSLLDATAGSRIPSTAVTMLSNALERGPVLLSLPSDAPMDALVCRQCHARARCARCRGPLVRDTMDRERLVCDWCGSPAGDWVCSECGDSHVRGMRVGALTTVEELAGLFGNVPITVSTQVQGIVARIDAAPRLVVATPWCEPFVQEGDYAAVALLDAWQSRFKQGIDARIDALVAWMHAASLTVPDSDGGRVVLLGDAFPGVWESMERWDPRILGREEIVERTQACFPPAITAADVWGNRKAVQAVLRQIGALDGDISTIEPPAIPPSIDTVSFEGEFEGTLEGDPGSTGTATQMPTGTADAADAADAASAQADAAQALQQFFLGPMPSVLGPIPMPPPKTVTERTFEGMDDRVRAVVRVPNSRADELAERLHKAAAKQAAMGYPLELRFQMYPKDLA